MSSRLRTVSIILAISAVLLFGSGVWLTVSGPPYTTGAPYAVHELGKLLVYILVIVAIVMAYLEKRSKGGLTMSEWILFGLSILFILVATNTGSAFLGRALVPSWELWLHRVSPWVAAILFGFGWNSLAKRG